MALEQNNIDTTSPKFDCLICPTPLAHHTDSTPLSSETWGLANKMTSESLVWFADLGGPRCCKRDTFLALKQASEFVQEHFSVTLPVSDPLLCDFSHLNRECLLAECPFHS